MEKRKEKEIEYYEKKAEEQLKKPSGGEKVDFENFNPFLLASYKFLKNYLKYKVEEKKILDYGCGNGDHSIWLAEYGGNVIGIDLSEKSLKLAKKEAEKERVSDKVEFLIMDAENLEFPDNYFDIVFDGGAFSSLNIEKVFPEISRVLKPGGFLIGIETLGHNPFTNLKRRINKITGKRTEWAVSHIFRMSDLKKGAKYFNKIEAYFFHLISWAAFPFLGLPGGKTLLKILESLDQFLLLIFPFLKRYSFKIVFIFSQPKK